MAKFIYKNMKEKLEKLFRTRPIKSDDSYINTETIYNGELNFMVLISFTKDYFSDAIEFLSACNGTSNIKTVSSYLNIKYVHSSYEEDTNTVDDDGYPIILIHEKNYILLGGMDKGYQMIYNSIDNLSNHILAAVTREIYTHRCSTYYNELIDSTVFSKFKFKYKDIKPKYNECVLVKSKMFGYDNVNLILSKLPKGFTGQNLLKFIHTYVVFDNDPTNIASDSTAYTYLYVYVKNYKHESWVKECFADMYSALIKNGSDEIYKNFVGPQYLVMDDDAIPGRVTDENLDEIFRQKYERFIGLADDDVEYIEIDENIGENDEEENIRKTDKIVEIPEGDEE